MLRSAEENADELLPLLEQSYPLLATDVKALMDELAQHSCVTSGKRKLMQVRARDHPSFTALSSNQIACSSALDL